MSERERGAAMIETAIALPVILVALYGVSWGIREGAVSERAESAVRYAGVVSAVQNPYHDYSLYALYNNLGATSNVQTSQCTPPSSLFLTGGTLPVQIPGTPASQSVTPSFWQPDSAPSAFCGSAPVRQLFSGANRSYLLLQSVPSISAVVSDGGFLGTSWTLGNSLATSYNFYRSPDVATLMHCINSVNVPVSASLAPLTYSSSVSTIAPLGAGDFNSQALSLDPNCQSGIGTQPPVPTPVPQQWAGGTTPPPSPGPGASPGATPTPNATATPGATPGPTAVPSASPTAAPSATPTPTPSDTPTPAPTPVPPAARSPPPRPPRP